MSDRDRFIEKQRERLRYSPIFGPPGPGRHIPILSEKPKETIKTLKKFFKYLSNYKLFFALIFTCLIGSSILSLIGPYLIGKGIDIYIIPKNFNGFGKFLLFMFLIYIFNSFLFYIQGLTMSIISQKVVFDIRKDMFECIHTLSLKVIDKRPIGDIMSRITNDIDMINITIGTSVVQFLSGIIMLVGTVTMMIILNPLLTLFSLILIPLMALITKTVSSKTRKYFFLQQTILGEVNSIVEEDITGLKIIKIYGKEKDEIEKFEEKNAKLKDYSIMAQKLAGIMPPLMNFLNNISFVIVGSIGGILAIKNIISIGTIASFINYVKQFTRPLNELAHQFTTVQSAIASAERVFELMEDEKERKDEEDSIELKEIKGEVEFKNVWFAYENEKYILKNISLKVPAGKTIAIVGPTGAGKTTMINLLSRLYEVEKGEIMIDGYNIKKIKKENLRSFLGVVLQDTYLFAETIKENIKYGRLDAKDEEIENICKITNAEKFILSLSDKYETFVSDGGYGLSQGQRQLIAIARTLLANPKILILDEATSSIDTKTEMDIQRSMLKLMKGKTSFVIAHRLNTIKNADIIVVINEGEIFEMGTHKELMNKKGFYYKLFRSQFGEIQ
ncbi:MAG: ABC transporter ATP-binding protein/permease [bacterium]|nr:ABC transporter ATP-binding protein/permease [bacterium]MDW8163505.1 ABC transporter ATP-binding protein [Candidatus Omnitrophota bacterium]